MVERTKQNIEMKLLTMGIFVDLSKAFDLLNHNLLIQKLSAYGVRGGPLNLIKSYLANRNQFVNLSGTVSTTKSISIGVPQGSILGPFLFVVFINDLAGYLKQDCVLYADDTNIFLSNSNVTELYEEANTTLEKLENWLTYNKLVPNVTKTHYIIFCAKNKQILDTPLLRFANINLTRVYETKFLGLTLDYQLTWHQHVKNTTNAIYRNIPILYKLRHIFPIKTLLVIYHSFIHSHILYGLSVYGLTYKNTLKPLETAQNTALRAMLFTNRRENTNFAYPLLNILPVHQCIEYRIALLTFNFLNNHTTCSSIKLTHQDAAYPFRSHFQTSLTVPPIRTNYGAFTFTYIATKIWNSLPQILTAMSSFHMFKKSLRIHIQSTRFIT